MAVGRGVSVVLRPLSRSLDFLVFSKSFISSATEGLRAEADAGAVAGVLRGAAGVEARKSAGSKGVWLATSGVRSIGISTGSSMGATVAGGRADSRGSSISMPSSVSGCGTTKGRLHLGHFASVPAFSSRILSVDWQSGQVKRMVM